MIDGERKWKMIDGKRKWKLDGYKFMLEHYKLYSMYIYHIQPQYKNLDTTVIQKLYKSDKCKLH